MADVITMVKGDREATAPISAFENVWKPKGWRIKGEKPAPAPKPVKEPKEESATGE